MRMFTSLLLAALLGCAGMARAQAPELDASVNEAVLMVPKKGGLFTFELETTLYKPDGDGPFPIAVINHGKAAGDPRFQGRYRPAPVARWFLARGYAVLVPMRQGFSKSGDSFFDPFTFRGMHEKYDPLRRAPNNCNRRGEGACRLYAVDDHVVWKENP